MKIVTLNRMRKFAAMLLVSGLVVSGTAASVENGSHQLIGGIDIYYGIISAQIVAQHPASHEEKSMHGGARKQRDEYHLVVAVFGRIMLKIILLNNFNI